MAGAGARAIAALKKDFRSVEEQVLFEFRLRTPGFGGEHNFAGTKEGDHEHFAPPFFTGEMVDSWEFVESGGRGIGGFASVAAVVNTSAHAGLVEFGWIAPSGRNVHEGGHRIIQNTLRNGRVRELYAAAAGKALIASLGTEDYGVRKKLTATAGLAFKRGEVANIRWRKGKIKIKGAVGQGISKESLAKVVNRLSEALVNKFNNALTKRR